jgi:hypothetical protein
MVEAYERRTREVIELFLNRSVSFPECIEALDAALGKLITKVKGKEFLTVTALAMANNETVMKEMERRGLSSD